MMKAVWLLIYLDKNKTYKIMMSNAKSPKAFTWSESFFIKTTLLTEELLLFLCRPTLYTIIVTNFRECEKGNQARASLS